MTSYYELQTETMWAVVENVVVVRERRGQGIGSSMLSHAIELSEKAGCYKIQVVSGPNEDQVRFYRKADLRDMNCRWFKRYFVDR